MVGAVGELASMKRRKLLGEDGLCCSSSAAQTRLGPSSLLGERSKTPIVFVVSFVSSATPQIGGTAKVYKKNIHKIPKKVALSQRNSKTEQRRDNLSHQVQETE